MTRDALRRLPPAFVLLVLSACDSSRSPSTEMVSAAAPAAESAPARRTNPYEGTLSAVHWPGEKHLANVRQLTFAGENAEAYWSADGRKLIFQSTRPPHRCDQIFIVDVESPGEPRLVSTGKGRTTCAYFFPGGERILYASTHVGGRECPPRPTCPRATPGRSTPTTTSSPRSADGSDLRRLTMTPGYDAEATISRDGKRIVFTSVRDGDLELYSMNADGGDVKRLTRTPGYDGGAFYSDDGEWIVYRASRPETPKAVEDFKALLDRNLVRPSRLEIRVMRSDGSGDRQVTNNGVASFAPYFFPRQPRQAPLRLEPRRPERPRLRHLRRQRGRDRPRTDHLQPDVRRVPDVLARREADRVLLEPPQRKAERDERLRGRLGPLNGQAAGQPAAAAGVGGTRRIDSRRIWRSVSPRARTIGPMKRPRMPNAPRPPKTPRNTTRVESSLDPLIRSGFRKLSAVETMTMPQIARNTAMPGRPWSQHAIAPGAHTMAVPPMGRRERTAIAAPARKGDGRPAINQPIPPAAP